MAFAIWSPTISRSLSAAGNGDEEMAGGESAAVWRFDETVTISLFFRIVREATISAHSQAAVIANTTAPIALNLIDMSREIMNETARNDCANEPDAGQILAGLPFNNDCLVRRPGD